jgi:hypothetical protein
VTSPRRAPGPDWPRVLVPAPGHLSPVSTPPLRERILHLALRSPTDPLTGLARALRSISTAYAEVDWRHSPDVCNEILDQAEALQPTLVWMQLQGPSLVMPRLIRALRRRCTTPPLIINWDGDQHHEPDDPRRQWFVELGHECDASLVVNTRHPARYAELGVPHPGFLGVGFDDQVWRPVEPAPDTPELVFLANYWGQQFPAYAHRNQICEQLAATYPDRFCCYGSQWDQQPAVPHRDFLQNHEEAAIYSAARAALSISIRCDLARYTSNRLIYGLGCGALMLVEDFPDSQGLGLQDGVNCLLWRSWDDLHRLADRVLNSPAGAWQPIRTAAYELSRLHTWHAHLPELAAIIHALRQEQL